MLKKIFNQKKYLLNSLTYTILQLLFVSCTPTNKQAPILQKNEHAFELLIKQFAKNVENLWGPQEVLIAGTKDYIKYSDQRKTRCHINFVEGLITVETVATINPHACLRKALVAVLLMGEPGNYDPFSEEVTQMSLHPFLYEQVVDENEQPIKSLAHANRFCEYLLQNKLQKRKVCFRKIHTIQIPLIKSHLDQRMHKYMPFVRQAAYRYKVDISLILAIIDTESSFNSYAVSSSKALGLMQIKAHTAGKDVFSMIKKLPGKPQYRYLLRPKNNIDIGTAYLHLLEKVYLAGINNPVSRCYAIISAYNSGAGGLLRVFSKNYDEALSLINSLSPDQFYYKLITHHPSKQARRYLYKVIRAKKNYQHIS